ncbi:MAG TPA: hypothetical protein EYG38_07645, partial [Verrucomicrobia bacterium]|nr:hypothetical protein [Verrucomicrobiota bacterium]
MRDYLGNIRFFERVQSTIVGLTVVFVCFFSSFSSIAKEFDVEVATLERISKAAEEGNVNAAYTLGQIYLNGQ